MKKFIVALAALACMAGNPYRPDTAPTIREPDPFRWLIEPQQVSAGAPDRLELRLVVPPGTSVYRDQLEVLVVDGGGLEVGPADLPPPLPVPEGERPRYEHDVVVWMPVEASASLAGSVATVEVSLRHQGCRKGLCWAPVTRVERVPVQIVSSMEP